jgi:putative aldouronate transport system permease protein
MSIFHKNKITLFDFFNGLLMLLFTLSIIFPFWHLLVISLESPQHATSSGIHIWPSQWSLANYKEVIFNKFIWNGYKNTLIRTIFGTAIQLFFTALAGYALSKRFFPHRSFWTLFIVFTMFFSGGLIPTYMLIRSLKLFDTYTVMILPGLIGAYNLVLMRNFFMSLPEEVEESCMIDGAGRFTIFFKIVIPISMPIIATISLWLAVGHWNAWFDVLLYVRDTKMFTLQIILRRIIQTGTDEMLDMDDVKASTEGVKAASIFIATLPILCVYPYIQKYFVKGIMVGSLKG